MEKEKLIGEQPQEQAATAEQSANIDRVEQAENGSLGKFKDTESLLSAYNNLQAEFTRKCQTLSQLQKEIADNVQPEVTPVYLNEDWNEKVYAFLENNKEAKPYAKEISQMILNDETLAKSQDALSLAWSKIALKNYKSPQECIEDDDFINSVVLKSEKIKQAVIKYVSEQINNRDNPSLINSNSGGSIGSPKIKSPANLFEAKELARKFFD